MDGKGKVETYVHECLFGIKFSQLSLNCLANAIQDDVDDLFTHNIVFDWVSRHNRIRSLYQNAAQLDASGI